jgi:hypothetical protein
LINFATDLQLLISMSRKEKLLKRFLTIPSDLTWNELVLVLAHLGYHQLSNGISGGSRRRFLDEHGQVISLHEPHPRKIVKKYVILQIIEHCKEKIKNHE